MENEIMELEQEREALLDNYIMYASRDIKELDQYMSTVNSLGRKIQAKKANMKYYKQRTIAIG